MPACDEVRNGASLPTVVGERIERVRDRRRCAVERIAGSASPVEELRALCEAGSADPDLADLYVVKALEAVPGLGKVSSRRILDSLEVRHRCAVADLGAHTVQEICLAVERELRGARVVGGSASRKEAP